MPDAVDFFNHVTKIPNLGIVSLAGSLAGHEVRVLDLVLHSPNIRQVLSSVLEGFRPHLVGLSAMSFQFQTAERIARFIRRWSESVLIAAGGYHATIMHQEIAAETNTPFDFLVRREGEATLKELADQLEKPAPDLRSIAGLSFRSGGVWHHNEDRPLQDLSRLPLPKRSARLRTGFKFLHLPMDVVEFSRGCPYHCRFCSIHNMYGSSYRRFPIERIIEDLKRIKNLGTKSAFIVDDNVIVDPDHFSRCCRAIVDNNLDDIFYSVQLGAAGIANNPELVAEMARANIRLAFVGFESMLPGNLKEMHKPASQEINRKAARLLRKHGIAIIAGGIVGFPEDTRETVKANVRMIRDLNQDLAYFQYLTPYPKTELREELLAKGLVTNPDDFSRYDGFTCNVRTHHLSQEELCRTLRREVLKIYLSPAEIGRNYFVRHMTLPFVASQAKVLMTFLKSLAGGGRKAGQLDI